EVPRRVSLRIWNRAASVGEGWAPARSLALAALTFDRHFRGISKGGAASSGTGAGTRSRLRFSNGSGTVVMRANATGLCRTGAVALPTSRPLASATGSTLAAFSGWYRPHSGSGIDFSDSRGGYGIAGPFTCAAAVPLENAASNPTRHTQRLIARLLFTSRAAVR